MPKKREWSKSRPKRLSMDPMLPDLKQKLAADKRSRWAKANVSGLAPATIKRIEDGDTRRPTGVTLHMLYKSLGYRLVPEPIEKKGK